MKKSTFKRIKSEEIANTNVHNFLKEAGYTLTGGILDLWVRGEVTTSNEMVVVCVNGTEEDFLNAVVYITPTGEKVIEKCDTMYQTFLAHKAARFQEFPELVKEEATKE